jgi:alpha-glucosidase
MAAIRYLLSLAAGAVVLASTHTPRSASDPLVNCLGYKASNVKTTSSGLTADLTLVGAACNAYGEDITQLVLQVVYEAGIGNQSSFYLPVMPQQHPISIV